MMDGKTVPEDRRGEAFSTKVMGGYLQKNRGSIQTDRQERLVVDRKNDGNKTVNRIN